MEQQARYYEVPDMEIYMYETYLNGNFSDLKRLYKELNRETVSYTHLVAHGIKSTYANFRAFEISRDNQRFVNLMDIFFSNQTDFWSDVETALGHYDEDSIIDFCNPEEEFDMDHPTRSEAAYSDSPDNIFQPLLKDLKSEFREWVDSCLLYTSRCV